MIEPSTSDDEVEEALAMAVEEVDQGLDPGAERDLVLGDPVLHPAPDTPRAILADRAVCTADD